MAERVHRLERMVKLLVGLWIVSILGGALLFSMRPAQSQPEVIRARRIEAEEIRVTGSAIPDSGTFALMRIGEQGITVGTLLPTRRFITLGFNEQRKVWGISIIDGSGKVVFQAP